MDTEILNELMNSFNRRADLLKNRLENLLATVSDGRIPDSETLRAFNADMDLLMSDYGQLKEKAKSILTAEEMPEEGSRASAYLEAVSNSRSRMIKAQIVKVETILQKFLKVKSHIDEYEAALSPYKEKALHVLNELSEDNVEDMIPETEAPELFLTALNLENINGAEGYHILEKINKYYPMQVQWGLAGRQYFIDESEIVDEHTAPEEPIIENKINNEEENEKLSEAVSSSDDAENDDENTNDLASDNEIENQEDNNSRDLILYSINKLKNSPPSASSFKKDIIRLAETNIEVRAILPMLTNLGVLTREQIFIVGYSMGYFEESDVYRDNNNAAIDALVGKGFLACFKYENNGTTEEVFCLSSYCHGCLNKESIYAQMRRFWPIKFGNVRVISSGEIKKSIVDKFVQSNEKLTNYLYVVKELVTSKEYRTIINSIKWKEDYYRIAVIDSEQTIYCCLYEPKNAPDKIDEQAILYVGSEEDINDAVKGRFDKIYVCHNQEVRRLGEHFQSSGKEVITEESKILDETSAVPVDENDDQNISEEVIYEEKDTASAEIIDKSENINSDEISTETASLRTLLNTEKIPTDNEFCGVLEQLLNREVTTKDQLTSLIAQTVSFAKAVGDVSSLEDRESKCYSKSYKLSAQIRLASNLMMNECAYTSDCLSFIFDDGTDEDPALMLSAYLFAMLVPESAYDYGLMNQTELLLAHYEDYFNDFAAFKSLFNTLMHVSEISSEGFSPALISLLGDDAESEKFIAGLRVSAQEFLRRKNITHRLKPLHETYEICFGRGSDLYKCMLIISNNRQTDVILVDSILDGFCDKQNGERNISRSKIEDKLDKAWYKANPQNKFKLEYDARDQALRQFEARLSIMQQWVEYVYRINNREENNILLLKELRTDILKEIQKIQKNSSWKTQQNANILAWNLLHMSRYLTGQLDNLSIFSEFLYTGILTVGNDGIPVIDRDFAKVKYYEPWRNVLLHIVSEKKSIDEVKAEILGDKLDEEGLKDNLHQLEMLGKLLNDNGEDFIITDGQLKDAKESADDRATRFQEKLELAYTYNQINETEKENLLGIVKQYKSTFYDAKDFACWRRFLEALERQITEFATIRKEHLRARLDLRLLENPGSSLLNEANRLLEEEMNFAVVEEYINRFESGETELDDVIFQDIDYFGDFIDPGTFDPLMRQCMKYSGRSLSIFGWNYIERNLPKNWTNRQKEDSKNLITNWPKGKGTAGSTQIKSLFTGLGFDVIKAERVIMKGEEVFKVFVTQTAKSMADYPHPISAFGTQVKSPVNAIMLYGNYPEKQLVDTVSNLDPGGISLVLLDRPVSVSYRRSVGQIFHTSTSGQNPFLLIDQVLLLYLALHQITERLPAMLKCTLPFTTYQPFVRDGGSTADEMFFGRTMELATIMDPNGACVVYGGRQLGKTALLERAESRCSKPENKAFAVYTSIIRINNEKEVTDTIVSDINNKVEGRINIPECNSLKDMCNAIGMLFRSNQIASMLLLIDEVDDFLASIADQAYRPLQPLVDLKRETKNNFKFVIAGLHNVCRAKNATRENGIFGQLGTPLCIKPLSPTDALQLISRPLRYLGFQIDRYPHLETILTNTNYYPGILQFFGYMLVETLTSQYSKYYSAANGNPPFTLQDEQLGAVMNSSDLNKSIKDKFRWSLELDPRYFMIARCITMLYHFYDNDRLLGTRQGFSVDEIMSIAKDYKIHCLENESRKDYINLLDEMTEMGILGKPDEKRDLYRLRRNSFVDIIGDNIEVLEEDIISNNKEASR